MNHRSRFLSGCKATLKQRQTPTAQTSDRGSRPTQLVLDLIGKQESRLFQLASCAILTAIFDCDCCLELAAFSVKRHAASDLVQPARGYRATLLAPSTAVILTSGCSASQLSTIAWASCVGCKCAASIRLSGISEYIQIRCSRWII